ncbi:excinuclease [Pseudomonas leptonychotis]|uniref:Excinuclease n=1 Tax=Pseudomonas leptonychotis TaxID=2448482 RepID=A0A4T1ZZJ8_9PSED|nr:excinuclease [Pseudomonas leptonychotis]TIH10065.1 excinuclease [Pseudomonas leptonychotis]|tara:strand:- start:204 stop:641 length:438 start_codon:yes stop_codon:yes gene_type:complete
MNAKTWILAAACISLFPAVSQARDTTHYLPFDAVVQEALQAGRLDGSVKFYLAGNPVKASIVKSGVTTSQKTNAFNKTDEAACSWALQSALIRFQSAAKAAGANAVVDLASNYKNVEYKDSQKYECHAGAIMAGVALKGNLANVK